MDPDANLKEQRELSISLYDAVQDGRRVDPLDVGRLCELVHALDDRMRGGGSPPAAWRRGAGR